MRRELLYLLNEDRDGAYIGGTLSISVPDQKMVGQTWTCCFNMSGNAYILRDGKSHDFKPDHDLQKLVYLAYFKFKKPTNSFYRQALEKLGVDLSPLGESRC